MTKDQAAKQAGCKVYDCALPQSWVDNMVHAITPKFLGVDVGGIICSSFIWSYDAAMIFGSPFPLTALASEMLAAYNRGNA